MAAGCAERGGAEAGVRMPRSVLAIEPLKGVKQRAEQAGGLATGRADPAGRESVTTSGPENRESELYITLVLGLAAR